MKMGTYCLCKNSTIFKHILGMCACYLYPCLFQLHVLTLFKFCWSVGYDKSGLLLQNLPFVVETGADRPEPRCHENEWNLVSLFNAL